MVSLPDGIHIETDAMTDLKALRQQALLPINQAAALKLRKVGIPAASDIQPVFQWSGPSSVISESDIMTSHTNLNYYRLRLIRVALLNTFL